MADNSVVDVEELVQFGWNERANWGECRICQDDDSISNMEAPCSCRGTLMYAHRKCVQQWCNEKGDISCEICHQPYQPGYTAPPSQFEATTIDIGGGWQISGTPLDMHDFRLMAIPEGELDGDDDDDEEEDDSDLVNDTGAAFFRAVALVLMALLLFRHAFVLSDYEEEDNGATFFTLIMLRTIGFILPCYVIAWGISLLHHRRQKQEAAAVAATQFAIALQTGQVRILHCTLPSAHSTTPPQEHV
ncbi:hypothetical protein DCAR_0832127 [Daucus carota subsp. sativus]|uniref:RING-CH-type domain-containing protein n=1 Tax=Daucus carota subsp. sativus TaxID=79200 RepID=A0A175YNW9_DAUCS|nr:PREDICTED: uncharacterized protein LOC108197873 [Daucus carota subsp. sativus]XP_017221095.1 PREDICTED: uncharacterized protein LOC108197873 [Daucus carota subsp. sativus]XP_017221096.1 PREDICTED: uncharacterized protein LOC108197873 [Daucus carota subsp. sativus]WOH12621.1 hypothetical protein DCAR_0832127 [Daucus carota subsp. sativus]